MYKGPEDRTLYMCRCIHNHNGIPLTSAYKTLLCVCVVITNSRKHFNFLSMTKCFRFSLYIFSSPHNAVLLYIGKY